MKKSIKIGLAFGLTSGIITTLGLMVGLNSGTHSQLVVIGGILTIAIADAFSDALGIHISQESAGKQTQRQIWFSTISTFLSKLIFALTFIIPVLLFELPTAIAVSIAWGLLLLTAISYYTAKQQKIAAWKAIIEHIGIAIVVIIITHLVGDWISRVFV